MTNHLRLLNAERRVRGDLGGGYLDALDEGTAICDNRPGPERACFVCGAALVDGACPTDGVLAEDRGQWLQPTLTPAEHPARATTTVRSELV